jgi:16S rRNA (uracil1498-N3)-methyltransferase
VRSSRLILPRTALSPGISVSLDPGDLHHLKDVLRLAPGDRVVVSDASGERFEAYLCPDGRLEVWDRVVLKRQADPVVSIRVIAGLAKSDRTEWAVEKATEAGVSEIRVAVCDRSVAKPREAEASRRQQRLVRVAREAAVQCGRSAVPAVSLHESLDAACADLPEGPSFLLDEAPGVPSLAAILAATRPGAVTLAAGPEGSFSDRERDLLRRSGFEPAGLGPRVFRAETAVVAAVIVAQSVIGDLA